MLKRTRVLQEQIMGEVFGVREAGEPLTTYHIARELNPAKARVHGTLHHQLRQLVAQGQLEIMELLETLIDHRDDEVHIRGYQKSVATEP